MAVIVLSGSESSEFDDVVKLELKVLFGAIFSCHVNVN